MTKKPAFRIEVFPRRGILGKRWYFRIIRNQNNKTVAPSEAYHNRADAWETATQLRAHMFDAELVQVER